jgi:response regulator RpfG family c-di-GMP phosphodiesterase
MVLNATFKTISMISWRSENLRSRCTTLCERQLSDDRFNNKLDKDRTKQFSDEITNELNNMYDNGDIDDKTLEYLIPMMNIGVEGGDIHSDQSSVGW